MAEFIGKRIRTDQYRQKGWKYFFNSCHLGVEDISGNCTEIKQKMLQEEAPAALNN